MATAVVSSDVASGGWRLKLPERLPDLRGKWLTLYTIVWAIMLPLAIIGPVRAAYRIHRWAERRFQKPLIRLREGLPDCVADLRESATVEQLVAAVMNRVKAGVRSTHEAVLLAESGTLVIAGAQGISAEAVGEWQSAWRAPAGEHPVQCDRRDPTFPLRLRLCIESGAEPETIAWLLLGSRPDGSFFGKDEREALEHVAGPVARAIHIAQLREQRDEQAERRISGLEGLIDKLVRSLNGTSIAELRGS